MKKAEAVSGEKIVRSPEELERMQQAKEKREHDFMVAKEQAADGKFEAEMSPKEKARCVGCGIGCSMQLATTPPRQKLRAAWPHHLFASIPAFGC